MTDSLAAARPSSRVPITDEVRAFLNDTRFATIATIDPDGAPRQAVVWYTVDGDEIVLNSAMGRRWPSNLLRDPRVAFSVTDGVDGYRWLGITGRVTAVRDQATAQADIAGMARRYYAAEPEKARELIAGRFQRQERVSFRLQAAGIANHLD
jgi:PPOX class probable F420-dependent enzyme